MNNRLKSAGAGTVEHPSETIQVVSFRLHQVLYALDIRHVQEIIKVVPATAVPHTPRWVAGVINLRGQIMPLLDLALLLHLRSKPSPGSERFVILRGTQYALALMVDNVHEVLRLPLQQLETSPVTTLHKDYIQAICRHQEQFVIVLDVAKIMQERCIPTVPHEEVV